MINEKLNSVYSLNTEVSLTNQICYYIGVYVC